VTASEGEIVRELAVNPTDQRLWLALYEKFKPVVYYSVYRACRGERELAADLTQDAFERFFKYADLKRFESDRQAIAFLREIAWNRLKSHFEKSHSGPGFDSEEVAADDTGRLDARHDLELLAKMLSPEDRDLLARLLDGTPIEKIARELDLRQGTVAVRTHRLINRIRRKINDL
jgi:RNA polymerase sigma factor (sigma-70 family)